MGCIRGILLFGREKELLNNNCEHLIYHYTDINALKSILTTQKLWMTSHRFLNDTQEFEEGFGLLKKSIDAFMMQNKTHLKESLEFF